MRQPRIPKATPPRTKKPQPWVRLQGHRAFVRTLPCLACGRHGLCEAAHVRAGTDGAAGRKPSDKYLVPLCGVRVFGTGCHALQHHIGELRFYEALMERGIADPWSVAARLWTISPDIQLGYRAILHARPGLLTAALPG